jgi:hypothetical protein
MHQVGLAGAFVLVVAMTAAAYAKAPAPGQTPQPFPGAQQPPRPSPQQPAPQQPAPQKPAAKPAAPQAAGGEPTEASLGLPLYPTAQFIASFDAGRGQRYYLFGTTQSFDAMVAYYRTYLKDRGDRVFEEPPTHMFEVGRFRDETMAFPPGITIKDYTWGGSKGYPNPKRGVEPDRFPTVIMVVPAPAGAGVSSQ